MENCLKTILCGLTSLPILTFAQEINQDNHVLPNDFDKNYGIFLPQEQPNNSWVDKKHEQTGKILDKIAQTMDDWFGTTDPNKPANASLRLISDTSWNETDGTTSKIRVRGKVKLPTLERRLSIVFGDERLDDVANRTNIHAPLPQNQLDPNSTFKQDVKENSSLAVRWSDFSEKLPFDTDFDIGIRSHGNIFAKVQASKDWQLNEQTRLFTEQTYRYSKRDKNEFFSYWEVNYQQDSNTTISLPFNVHYQDNSDDDFDWNSSLLHTHFYKNQRKFSYGLYTDGHINDNQMTTNRKGVVASWRQPIWKDWLFLQTDIDYLDNKRENRDHEIGGLLRLEAIF
nr:hypothetical protein [uncultured Moraxella sp.]